MRGYLHGGEYHAGRGVSNTFEVVANGSDIELRFKSGATRKSNGEFYEIELTATDPTDNSLSRVESFIITEGVVFIEKMASKCIRAG